MEALVLCEIAAGREDLRETLLARIGRLGLNGRAKLSFVGRQQAPAGAATVIAVGFAMAADAERFLAACVEAGLPAGAARLLRLDPPWQAEPLPLMFP